MPTAATPSSPVSPSASGEGRPLGSVLFNTPNDNVPVTPWEAPPEASRVLYESGTSPKSGLTFTTTGLRPEVCTVGEAGTCQIPQTKKKSVTAALGSEGLNNTWPFKLSG